MNIFLYPPVFGFGMATLFDSAAPLLSAQGVTWETAPSIGATPSPHHTLACLYSFPDPYASFRNWLVARQAGLRTVAMALYWDPTRYILQGLRLAELPDSGEQEPSAADLHSEMLDAELTLLRAVYRATDIVIALSTSEAEALVNDFGIARERIVIAWCGNGATRPAVSPELFRNKFIAPRFGARDFVLCVGRVDANKNQLNLIRALRDENIPLVLAGGSLAPTYLEACQESVGENVLFLPALSDEELASAYAAARVHSLASWLEVVGFVTLEAAVAGCNVVLTREHGARDYVGDAGWYCDSADVASIRRAVVDAYRAPRRTALREHLLSTYSWDKHAQALAVAFRLAETLPPLQDDADARANLEQAARALTTLVPALQESRAGLWREKTEIARQRDAYARGRVMRALTRTQQAFKRSK